MVRRRPGGRFASSGVAALLGVVLLAVSACSGSSAADDKTGEDGKGGDPGNAISLAITPEDGAADVATTGEIAVAVDHGTLTAVSVTDAEGTEVPGELMDDNSGWQAQDHLANDTAYTVTATAEDKGGASATETSTFTTVAAGTTFSTSWTVVEGSEYGVGMILSVTFDAPIENTSAVADAIRITTEPAVEVEPHWFGSHRVDFRPQEYWEPGTEVGVQFRLRGVEGSQGVYGTASQDVNFTIGRSQITTVDDAKLTMDVVRDGEKVKTFDVTTGAPGMTTWNGKMVISEKYKETRMDGATVGFDGDYDIPDVPHAMRLSQSGTFIHGNYWGGDIFGNGRASHGCIGLRDTQGAGDPSTDGAWFYDNSLVGDVVEVINSNDDILAPDNGLSGWNMDWSEWGAGQ
ncbi:L,D-transpeptidase [Streptomyces sp. NRRL F-2890]|uniref:L,D-transpeptidase n=1 Tax=Streptomyces sp. NRRL F-2890 TaxID=1463845 RepID=UPI0005BC5690|nr:Ig-like domain-containing protein [Streptomyces sp. NRRL F-2890]